MTRQLPNPDHIAKALRDFAAALEAGELTDLGRPYSELLEMAQSVEAHGLRLVYGAHVGDLRTWLQQEPRPSAIAFFKPSPTRAAAQLIELAERQQAVRGQALRRELELDKYTVKKTTPAELDRLAGLTPPPPKLHLAPEWPEPRTVSGPKPAVDPSIMQCTHHLQERGKPCGYCGLDPAGGTYVSPTLMEIRERGR